MTYPFLFIEGVTKCGYSLEQAAQLAESTSVLLNVSEFKSIDDATSALVSTMQAFGYAAEDSMQIVDVMNEIGNNYAISSDGIATALQDSASSLMAANNSYQEAVALVASANKVVQDPNSVGSALRTISLRLRGTSAKELGDAGEETDGAITSKSKLRGKIKALSGIDILTDSGAYKSTYEILLEISRVWKEMSDVDQAALLEIIAGKTRSNTAAAILSNTTDLENAYVDALKAEGSALAENEKYLDSIQGRIDLFTNAVQTMWSNALNSDAIKLFLDIAKKVIQVIDWMNEHFTILGTTIISLGAFNGFKTLFSAFNVSGKFTAFINAISGNTMRDAWKNLKNLSVASREVTASTLALRVETGKMTAMEAVRQATTRNLVLSRISLTDATAKELLNATALTEVEKQEIITKLGLNSASKTLTLSKLQQAVADNKLTTSEALHMAMSARLIKSQASLTAAKATDILMSQGVQEAEANQIVTKLGLGSATKLLTADMINEMVASGALSSAQGSLALSLLGTTAAANGLKASLMSLWTAIWPMLILAGAAAIIYGIVKAIDKAIVTNDELAESIENTRTEIENIESEIESLNNQIKEIQSRIAELTSMPSLSFTEQEELENLKQQNDELERTLQLQEALKAQKEAKLKTDTKQQIENTWYNKSKGKKDYSIDKNGVITYDDFWSKGIGGKEAVNQAIKKYDTLNQEKIKLENLYQKALTEASTGNITKDTYKAISEASGFSYSDAEIESYYESMLNVTGQEEYLENFKKNRIDDVTSTLQDISDGISLVLGDMATTAEGLSYGDDEYINQFLDELNYTTLKWNEVQGISATSSAIKSMFDDTQNQATKNIETKLKEIAASDEYANTEEGNAKRIADATKVVQSALDDTSGTYSRLQTAMETMGLSANEVARYFVQLSQAPDSDTVQGITAQYQKGIDVLEQFKNKQKIIYEDLNGNKEEIGFDDLFKFDDVSGKWEAIDTQIAKVLQGADETARKEFGRLAEAVKNGGKDFDEAITSFNISGLLAVTKLTEETLTGLNQDIFKGVKDDISGLIDTFKELSTALEDTASAMDLLHSAQQQMNNSGQISVKTALALIESTDNWADVLTISEDKITLNKNAEEALIGSKLQLIEKNIDLALTEAQLQLAQLEGTEATINASEADIATAEAQKVYSDAMQQSSAVAAGLGAAMGALVQKFKALSNLDFNSDAWNTSMISAFNNAYDAALKISTKDDTTSAAELKKKINDLKAQKALISKIGNAKDFKNYYDYDKTPGDKYSDGKSALDRIKEKYERLISDYSNQQTYLQNEVDRLQAENEAVSKSYYEEQIAIEEKKLKLYEQERKELLALMAKTKKGTDQWYEIADAVWDVEHAIQGSVKAMVDFRKEIVNLYKEAFDKIGTAYGDLDDLLDDQQNYIDKYNELLELQKKPVTESSIKEQLAIEQEQLKANEAQLISLRKTRDDALANSTMKEGDEEWIAMESSIRDVEAAILDNQIAIENYKQAIIDLYTETFDKLNNMFSNKNDFFTSQQDYIEGYADYLETLGVDVPQEVYDKLIEIEQDKREVNVKNLIAARNHLADLEKKGLNATDEEWVNAKNKAVELEKAILDNDKAMAEWQKTINELNFTKFDDFIDRIGNLESEIKNIIGLLYKKKEDIALKNGDWTDEGITTLGLYYQQMEIAKQKAKEYADEIDKLTKSYEDGEISEKDYYERLQTLKDSQWDAINNYEDMKDAIVDLNEARIDMIEEGYQKEIKVYSELIKLKKEELDAERDLYEFKKNVEDQTKNIAELERKIASLSGSTAASDVAERRRLQAELNKANQSLNDTYYTHAKDAQGNALDKENELYEKTRTDNIEELREKLKNVDQVLEETISKVLENANTALDTINGVSSEYGISISGNLIKPWQEAAKNAEDWKNEVNEDLGEAGSNANKFKVIVQNAFTISGKSAESFAESVQTVCNNIETAIGTENEGFTSRLEGYLKYPWENTSAEDGPITTFSEKVEIALDNAIDYAEDSYYKMKNSLEAPWEDANLDTFSENVRKVLNQAVKDSEDKAAQISKNLNVTTPNYTSGTAGTSGNGGTTNTDGGKPANEGSEDVKMLQKILKDIFGQPITVDGKYGPATKNAVKSMQQTLKTAKLYTSSIDGLYGSGTAASLQKYVNSIIRQATGSVKKESWFNGKVVSYFQSRSNYVPSAMYAKGTMGTKRDEWAITDEPQYGDELTMYATPAGTLSYMRVGSTVIPADETKKILEMVDAYQPNMMNSSILKPMLNNVVTNNNNSINLNFESFIKAENISDATIPELSKMIDKKIDDFSRKLNYALRRA